MRQMKAVHSRIGLTFTALVEIAVSTVTSLSVCALVGFKVTMVPWYVGRLLRIQTYDLCHLYYITGNSFLSLLCS